MHKENILYKYNIIIYDFYYYINNNLKKILDKNIYAKF